ncbi:hypothetical protein [Solibaculum mannosilyticum]|uniref:IPT/TIG domain-containing protein n=1 Tax=Solibaculum mannosilyticum TaxID=2780922 RepID=A0A7I8D1K8_9FIRM|nr:hypothetical protein [Solibaculum mannosilyticum]BCI60697.1 hypothetical protein C12CBH8_13360 [Solibaculum mannosilyticum]
MKKKRIVMRFISLGLCLCLLTGVIAGCKKESISEEDYTEGSVSSPIVYNSEGQFTTTVTLEGTQFLDGIEVKDVTVQYQKIDERLYEEMDSLPTVTDENGEEMVEIPEKYRSTVTAQVDQITQSDSKTLEISFTDSTAKEAVPDGYTILVDKKRVENGKPMAAYGEIQYPSVIAQSDVEEVLSSSRNFNTTLTLENGFFQDSVTVDDITLGEAFEGMTVVGIQDKGGSLEISLSGTINSQGNYSSGSIRVAKEAVKDGINDVLCDIPVKTPSLMCDISGLTYENGFAVLPIHLLDATFNSEIREDSFAFAGQEGITVKAFEKTSDTQGVLTLDVPAADIDEAASLLDGGEITLEAEAVSCGEEITAVVYASQAQPKVVFDYVEEQDGKIILTLDIRVQNGSFTGTLADAVTVGGDLTGAQISFATDGDQMYDQMLVTLPASGDLEGLDLTGTVTFAAGCMENLWGTPSEEITIERGFSQETLGKTTGSSVITSIGDFLTGTVGSSLANGITIWGGISSLKDIGSTIGQWMGIVESPGANELRILNLVTELNQKVDEISNKISALNGKMDYINAANKVDSFNSRLNSLYETTESFYRSINSSLNSVLKTAQQTRVLGMDGQMRDAYTLTINGEQYEIPEEFYNAYQDTKTVNTTDANTIKRWTGYESTYDQLMERIAEATIQVSKNEYSKESIDVIFKNLSNDIVAQDLLGAYDLTKDYQYNFSTQSCIPKEKYRSYINGVMQTALITTLSVVKSMYPDRDCSDIMGALEKLGQYMDNNSDYPTIKDDKYIYFHIPGKWVEKELVCIALNWERSEWYGALTNTQIDDFIRRLDGKTVRQELEGAGFIIAEKQDSGSGVRTPIEKGVTQSLTLRIWREDDDSFFTGYTRDYSQVVSLDTANPKQEKYKAYDHTWNLFKSKVKEYPVYSFRYE